MVRKNIRLERIARRIRSTPNILHINFMITKEAQEEDVFEALKMLPSRERNDYAKKLFLVVALGHARNLSVPSILK